MAEVSLNVSRREISTKGAVNQARREGLVPGVFYVHGESAVPFSVVEQKLNTVVFSADTRIINLIIDEEESKRCIVKEIQFDPVTDRVIHVDFQGLTAGEKIQLQIPVLLSGAAIGVREGGLLQQYLHKIDVECLPKDIPQKFEINISQLKVGDTVHISDLNYENVTILNATNAPIVGVTAPKAAAVEGEAADALAGDEPTEPEVIGKGKSEDDDNED